MNRKPDRNNEEVWSPVFTVGAFLTGAYYLGAGFLLIVRGTSIAELQALELNEVGDLLAGIFAPLAFLWLVLAVLIQRRELGSGLIA